MNRTTILMETSYLLAQPKQSMSQKLMDIGTQWFIPGRTDSQNLEHVRSQILAELNGDDGCLRIVNDRVHQARDIADLWFLRCSLAAALTVDRGPDAASVSMQEITALFDGLLPKGMGERRSSLNH
ncbi:MAG: hypothetical protein EOP50_09170 [Sphingobacteriales bacterium]|nr:MAG: hypothetical protein EOP50_09170 [Sphingobacteriales bacterium]